MRPCQPTDPSPCPAAHFRDRNFHLTSHLADQALVEPRTKISFFRFYSLLTDLIWLLSYLLLSSLVPRMLVAPALVSS